MFSGVDINTKIVKHCVNELLSPLISIINKSFLPDQFPSALKISKVYHKHKNGPNTWRYSLQPLGNFTFIALYILEVILHVDSQDLPMSQKMHHCKTPDSP